MNDLGLTRSFCAWLRQERIDRGQGKSGDLTSDERARLYYDDELILNQLSTTGIPRSSLERVLSTSISRVDLAAFTLKCAYDATLVGKAPFVSE